MVGGVFQRATANRVPSVEIEQIVGQLTAFAGWYGSWAKAAAAHQELADSALRQGRKHTARQAYVLASYLYFYAQAYARAETDKAEGSARMVECYRRAASLLDPPAERVEIPHLGTA